MCLHVFYFWYGDFTNYLWHFITLRFLKADHTVALTMYTPNLFYRRNRHPEIAHVFRDKHTTLGIALVDFAYAVQGSPTNQKQNRIIRYRSRSA